MKNKSWLFYALITTVLWGVWGALIEIPEKAGFPATLGYAVWALTLIPVSLVALRMISWRLDRSPRAMLLGIGAGLMGSGGQLILFETLRLGPAYIVFPLISLYPVVTIILSVVILGEKAGLRAWTGIVVALIAVVLFSYQEPSASPVKGFFWMVLAMIVFFLWGVQAFLLKLGGDASEPGSIRPESFTFYTMVSSVMLIPIALYMTDFRADINWGFSGLHAAVLVQLLNAAGFLFFAYTLRYGKAIVAVPLMSLAPVVTVSLSLLIYAVIPHPVTLSGMLLAFVAIFLLSRE